MDHTTKSGNCKASGAIRPAYARFYASKWRSGTLMLSLEEEGLYIRVSAFQMECGQPIPEDWKAGAKLLCVQPLRYRKIMDQLIARGLLTKTEDGIVCERAMLEFKRATKGVEGDKQPLPNNPHTYPDTNPVCNPVSMGVEAKKDQQNQTDFRNRREEKKEEEVNTERGEFRSSHPPLGFAGHFIQLSEEELDDLKGDFVRLDFPADLKTADQFLDAVPTSDTHAQRFTRLRQYLGKRNAERGRWSPKAVKSAGGLRAVSDRVKSEERAH